MNARPSPHTITIVEENDRRAAATHRLQNNYAYKTNNCRSSMDKEESERDRMILKHIGLVRHLIKPYLNGNNDVEDLLHSGIVGLVEAADRYHSDRGAAFGTFAGYYIIDNVLDQLNRQSLMRIPDSQRKKLGLLRRAERAYVAVHYQPPSDDYLADHLRAEFPAITKDEISLLRKAWRKPASLDKLLGEETTLHDHIGTPDNNKAEGNEEDALLKNYVSRLPPFEQAIIRHRFYDHMEFRDIGNKLGKGLSTIMTQYRKALRDLRIMADKQETTDTQGRTS